jgi:hypothetical protein
VAGALEYPLREEAKSRIGINDQDACCSFVEPSFLRQARY